MKKEKKLKQQIHPRCRVNIAVDEDKKYMNDDDLVMDGSDVVLVMINKGDLPYTEVIDKVDTLSRYVNDDDIVQLEDDVNNEKLDKGDLPYTEIIDKVDTLSRYVNDDDI